MTITSASDESPRAVLLYDGDCGLCARSVQFVLNHESVGHPHALLFAPLAGAWATALRERMPTVRDVDSAMWYSRNAMGHERVRLRSDAVLATLDYVGGGWRLAARVMRVVPRRLRDAVYNAVARRRTRLAPRGCVVPQANQRARFLP